jgi:hypothetical protein
VFSKCANPDCLQEFDYRRGRYFRFHQGHRAGELPANTHSVQHFWLCETCSHEYTPRGNKKTMGVVLMFPYGIRLFPPDPLISVL